MVTNVQLAEAHSINKKSRQEKICPLKKMRDVLEEQQATRWGDFMLLIKRLGLVQPN